MFDRSWGEVGRLSIRDRSSRHMRSCVLLTNGVDQGGVVEAVLRAGMSTAGEVMAEELIIDSAVEKPGSLCINGRE